MVFCKIDTFVMKSTNNEMSKLTYDIRRTTYYYTTTTTTTTTTTLSSYCHFFSLSFEFTKDV